VAVVAVILIAVFASGGSKADFGQLFAENRGKSWCTIGTDGNYMNIDTNPHDIDDDFSNLSTFQLNYGTDTTDSIKKYIDERTAANTAIKKVLADLGFSDAVYAKMGETSSLQGRQTDENNKYKVSWTYHPDKGLEVMFERK